VISNAVFLIDEAAEVGGFRVWGSPMTTLYGGAFGRSASADRARVYSGIPESTDILVTHGPPFGVLDRPRGTDRRDGCRELLAAVSRIRPRLSSAISMLDTARIGRMAQFSQTPLSAVSPGASSNSRS
jgi:hypothetical protein